MKSRPITLLHRGLFEYDWTLKKIKITSYLTESPRVGNLVLRVVGRRFAAAAAAEVVDVERVGPVRSVPFECRARPRCIRGARIRRTRETGPARRYLWRRRFLPIGCGVGGGSAMSGAARRGTSRRTRARFTSGRAPPPSRAQSVYAYRRRPYRTRRASVSPMLSFAAVVRIFHIPSSAAMTRWRFAASSFQKRDRWFTFRKRTENVLFSTTRFKC